MDLCLMKGELVACKVSESIMVLLRPQNYTMSS